MTIFAQPQRGTVRAYAWGGRNLCSLVLAAMLGAGAAGCTSGPMKVSETYYLKVTNGQDNAYFRVNVEAATQLSDAQYKSGWYPAEAVDAVLGSVSEDATGETRAARDAMRDNLTEALKTAHESYLRVALDPNSTSKQIEDALEIWKRTRFAPGFRGPELSDAILVEFNPSEGLETFRSDDKLIFVLSANPDQIIQSISRFASDQETKAAIQRFANVIIESEKAGVSAEQAAAAVDAEADKFVAGKVEALTMALDNRAARDVVVRDMGVLQTLIRGLQ